MTRIKITTVVVVIMLIKNTDDDGGEDGDEDDDNDDHPNRGYSLFLLLVHPQPRPVHSRWLVPQCGMGFRCRKDCSPGFFLTHSTLVSKLFFLAVQGSGALLSSNLEGALYKISVMNE